MAHQGFLKDLLSGWAEGAAEQIVIDIFGCPTIGMAICDAKLRFSAVNNALASMNGITATEHIGKTIRDVLGTAATQVESAFLQVIATGKPLLNFELSAELPTRTSTGHWIENYYPVKDQAGNVQHVVATIIETTKQKNLEKWLRHLMGIVPGLTAGLIRGEPPTSVDIEAIEAWITSLEMLKNCVGAMGKLPPLEEHHDLVPPSAHAQIPPFPVVAPGGRKLDGKLEVPLSQRERQILRLIAEGESNKEIATHLNISTKTVENHRAKIMLKLHIHSAIGLVRYAIREKIVED